MGCTPSRPTVFHHHQSEKREKGDTTPVTAQDTDRQAAAVRAQDWTPTDEPWIKPSVAYSVKFFRHDQPCVIIDMCCAPEIPSTSDKFSVFCAIENGAEQSLQRFCFVVNPANVVMGPASVYNGARDKVCTKAIAASSYHFGEKMDQTYEIVEPDRPDLPAPYDIQLPPLSAFERAKNGVVFSNSRMNLLITQVSSKSVEDAYVTDDHDLRPALITTSMSTDDASPPFHPQGRPVSVSKEPAHYAGALHVSCEAELEKLCTNESASYAVLPRAHFEDNLLPILEREAVNGEISDVTSVPGTAAAAAAVGASITGAAAGPVFDTYTRYGVPKRKLFITPEHGFVILCKAAAAGTGRTYINVLHHPDVGGLIRNSADSTPTASHSHSPDRMAVIVSTCTPAVETHKGQVTVLDVVVPSSELKTFDGAAVSRAEVAKKVLQALQALDFTIDAEHTLPHVPNDYFPHSGDPALPTTVGSTMNLTEVEKADYSVLALCKLHKQGHIKHNWRERVALFTDTKVFLFDKDMHLKEDFPMENTSAELTGTMGAETKVARTPTHHRSRSGDYDAGLERPVSTAAPFSAYRPPADALPFQMRNLSPAVVPGSKDHIAYCAAPTMEVMDCLWEMLRVRDSHVAALSTMLRIPTAKAGWLEKEGHMVKNWKPRFFVLSYGVLEYSKKPMDTVGIRRRRLQQQGTGLASASADAMGSVDLTGATVAKGKTSPRSARAPYRLTIQDKKGSRLALQTKSADELDEWFDAIQRHIEYAKRHFK